MRNCKLAIFPSSLSLTTCPLLLQSVHDFYTTIYAPGFLCKRSAWFNCAQFLLYAPCLCAASVRIEIVRSSTTHLRSDLHYLFTNGGSSIGGARSSSYILQLSEPIVSFNSTLRCKIKKRFTRLIAREWSFERAVLLFRNRESSSSSK